MLLRPKRPLPRRFSRRASKSTSEFVRKRHQRHRQYKRERWMRFLRRAERTLVQVMGLLRAWLWLSLGTVVLVAVGVLLFSPLVHVREIHVRRTDTRLDSERIEQALQPVFGEHLFSVSTMEVEGLVRGAMPDVASVQVQKVYPSTLVLTITLHPLVARLQIAEDARKTITASGSVVSPPAPPAPATFDYLTDNGLLISLPFSATGGQLPLIRIVDWAVHPVPSTPLLSMLLFQRMQEAEAALRTQFNLPTVTRTVYLRAREFHLSTSKLSFWFDMGSPLQEQLDRLRVFLASVGLGSVRSYVDLRLAGRVVYR